VALILGNRTTRQVQEAKDVTALGQLADAYSLLEGHERDAREALSAVEQLTVKDNDNELMGLVAGACEQVGDRSRAIHWLSRAVTAGYSCDKVKRSPFLEELRKDPGYAAVGCK
jgi:uncharacterized membrane-anchored protein